MQIEMNFIGHIAENNSASQNHYDKNFDKFSEQCKYLFKLLMNGNKITVKEAILKHGISSLPRRVKDLSENDVQISWEWQKEIRRLNILVYIVIQIIFQAIYILSRNVS